MKHIACLALSLSLASFSALAQTPTKLVPVAEPEVDETAPVGGGIEVVDTRAADISTLTLFTPESASEAWLTKAWSGVYYAGKIKLSDIEPAGDFFKLDTKSLPLALYDLLVAGGEKPENLLESTNWLMQRVDVLEKLGFLQSAYDLLDAIPRSQTTNAMLKKKMLYAASLNKWENACEVLGEFPQDGNHLLSIFCEAKTKGFDKAALTLSVLEEEGKPPPIWFIQLLEAMRYDTEMHDLPPHQDPLTWAMVLSVGADKLPKDTITDAWLETATTPQKLQLWHTLPEESPLEHKLHKHLNHFSYGHFAPGQPNSYRDERHALTDHVFKRDKADDTLRLAADHEEQKRPLWDEMVAILYKLNRSPDRTSLPDPAPLLRAEGGYPDAWAAVMRAYVLADALGYQVRPEYWTTLGEFAEGKAINLPQRYVAPNMLGFIEELGDPAHRTDVLLTTIGLLGTKDALREQPDLLQAALLRALTGAGLDELARDLAVESILSLLPRD